MEQHPNTMLQNRNGSIHIDHCDASSITDEASHLIPRLAYVVAFTWLICLGCVMVSSCERSQATENDVKEPSLQHPNNAPGTRVTIVKVGLQLHLSEIEFSTQLTKKQVLSDWGPPDAIKGFGVEYLVYTLDDGRLLWLHFASQNPQPLLRARVYDTPNDTEGKTVFDGRRINMRSATRAFGGVVSDPTA